METKVFGPVPSRRLGKSVGINNIPPKQCSYSCVYCQLGRSLKMLADRQIFYPAKQLFLETRQKLENARINNETIDYLTIVSDGEPTLDASLGELITLLGGLGIKIAVITNATLLNRPEVRKDLNRADWVSVKVDTLDEKTWRKIDRPHKDIRFNDLLDGISLFSREFKGCLVTETMLVKNLNDGVQGLEKTADFISRLQCSAAYLSIPTRPPALNWVRPPSEKKINRAYQIFDAHNFSCEYLIGYEGSQFAYTGDVKNDVLSITAVHPMREDAVYAYLKKAGGEFSQIEALVKEKKLRVLTYRNELFYVRALSER